MTSDHRPSIPWTSYAALGDSFSEGLWDPYPDEPDRQRGWADLFAAHLGARRVAAGDEPLAYANLAIRGRKLPQILGEQVPTALAMKPGLVSIIGGGNDLLRPGSEPDQLAAALERTVEKVRAQGVDVLLATGFDCVRSPLVNMTRSRVGIFNSHIWAIARRHGAYVLDLWGMRALQDWRMWSDDRIHLTPAGHERVAQAALVCVGLEPDDAAWDDPLVPLPPPPPLDRARENAKWFRVHVIPWAQRRLTGTSSGDGRGPKAPALQAWPVGPGPSGAM